MGRRQSVSRSSFGVGLEECSPVVRLWFRSFYSVIYRLVDKLTSRKKFQNSRYMDRLDLHPSDSSKSCLNGRLAPVQFSRGEMALSTSYLRQSIIIIPSSLGTTTTVPLNSGSP